MKVSDIVKYDPLAKKWTCSPGFKIQMRVETPFDLPRTVLIDPEDALYYLKQGKNNYPLKALIKNTVGGRTLDITWSAQGSGKDVEKYIFKLVRTHT